MRARAGISLMVVCDALCPPLRQCEKAGPEKPSLSVARPRWGGTFRRPPRPEPSTPDPAHVMGVYGASVARKGYEGRTRGDRPRQVPHAPR